MGVYPPASCGFYALYDGKADYFFILGNKKTGMHIPVFCYLWFSFNCPALFQTCLTVNVSLI